MEPLQNLKKDILQKENVRLNAQDMLTALSIQASTNPIVEEVLAMLKTLKGTEAHSSILLSYEDKSVLKSLKVNITEESLLTN